MPAEAADRDLVAEALVLFYPFIRRACVRQARLLDGRSVLALLAPLAIVHLGPNKAIVLSVRRRFLCRMPDG